MPDNDPSEYLASKRPWDKPWPVGHMPGCQCDGCKRHAAEITHAMNEQLRNYNKILANQQPDNQQGARDADPLTGGPVRIIDLEARWRDYRRAAENAKVDHGPAILAKLDEILAELRAMNAAKPRTGSPLAEEREREAERIVKEAKPCWPGIFDGAQSLKLGDKTYIRARCYPPPQGIDPTLVEVFDIIYEVNVVGMLGNRDDVDLRPPSLRKP